MVTRRTPFAAPLALAATLALTLSTTQRLSAQVAGDTCASPISLGSGDVQTNVNFAGASSSAEPVAGSCPDGGTPPPSYAADLWLEYTATAPWTAISTSSSDGHPFSIYENCAAATAGQALACFGGSFSGGTVVATTPGNSYLLRIGANSSGSPTFLHLRAIETPTNDECATATDVGAGSMIFDVSTVGTTASVEPPPSSCSLVDPGLNLPTQDIWLQWTADEAFARLEWFGFTAASHGPALVIYASCADATVNNPIVCSLFSATPPLTLTTIPGETYWIRVINPGLAISGVGELQITNVGSIVNDDCATATHLGTGTLTTAVEMLAATVSNHPLCSGPHATDVFFTWTAAAPLANIQWEGLTLPFVPVLAVYLDCADVAQGVSLSCISSSKPHSVTIATQPGHTYLLRTCRADFYHFWLERTLYVI